MCKGSRAHWPRYPCNSYFGLATPALKVEAALLTTLLYVAGWQHAFRLRVCYIVLFSFCFAAFLPLLRDKDSESGERGKLSEFDTQRALGRN